MVRVTYLVLPDVQSANLANLNITTECPFILNKPKELLVTCTLSELLKPLSSLFKLSDTFASATAQMQHRKTLEKTTHVLTDSCQYIKRKNILRKATKSHRITVNKLLILPLKMWNSILAHIKTARTLCNQLCMSLDYILTLHKHNCYYGVFYLCPAVTPCVHLFVQISCITCVFL